MTSVSILPTDFKIVFNKYTNSRASNKHRDYSLNQEYTVGFDPVRTIDFASESRAARN